MEGLKQSGLDVNAAPPERIDRDTVVVMWNRYGMNHDLACRVEAAGGRVLVAENGYLNRGGGTAKFDLHEGVQRDHYYALALGGHNGSGLWVNGGPERWRALGIDLQPWRTTGEHILVCPSRPFGRPDMVMPANWVDSTVKALQKATARPIRVREHPGNSRPQRELAEDLQGAWAVVTWYSSAGVHALLRGIPVVCMAPHWICKEAAMDSVALIDSLAVHDGRQHAFERLAWAQWTVDEIASGEPFKRLLN